MIKRIVNTEDDTITINELEDIIKDNYPVAMRNKLEVSKFYDDTKYKIVKDIGCYRLVNITTLSVVYASTTNSSLLDFIKGLIENNYTVRIQIDDKDED